MFENCTIKYQSENGKNVCVNIIHQKKDDGSTFTISVPLDEANTDYQDILKWVADGNTIQEAD